LVLASTEKKYAYFAYLLTFAGRCKDYNKHCRLH